MIADLRLIETYNGGDIVLKGNDIEMISGFQNMPYIGMFGGNRNQSTTGPKVTEQAFDFWGNNLFDPNGQDVWFNSLTEQMLNITSLTSQGRLEIEQTVKKDIDFLTKFATVTVSVQLVSVDTVIITIEVQEPNIKSSETFTYIWSATQSELNDQSLGSDLGAGIGLNTFLNLPL